jgi:hypothetical protein
MVFHCQLGIHALEFVVLRFQVPQTLNVRGLHTAIFGLPYVVRRVGNPQLAAHVFYLPTALDLLQRRDDPTLGELAFAQRSSP